LPGGPGAGRGAGGSKRARTSCEAWPCKFSTNH